MNASISIQLRSPDRSERFFHPNPMPRGR